MRKKDMKNGEQIMEVERCENCNEPLNEIELAAKHEDKADVWCCSDCFGDGSMGYTDHGKNILLMNFVKLVSKQSCCNVCECIPCQAVKILRQIEENE